MGCPSPVLAAIAVGTLLLGSTRSVAQTEGNLADFVASLPTEAADCAFLATLCVGARESTGRAERSPGSRDVLVDRQRAIAGARIDDAIAAAREIERKRGRRLACFDRAPCLGVLPRPVPAAAPPRQSGR
jgi:hypothetical protein